MYQITLNRTNSKKLVSKEYLHETIWKSLVSFYRHVQLTHNDIFTKAHSWDCPHEVCHHAGCCTMCWVCSVPVPVLICVDAFVQTNDTHMELCRALKTSRSDACRFSMRVDKLDLTCLGVARISVLLEQVEPQVNRCILILKVESTGNNLLFH